MNYNFIVNNEIIRGRPDLKLYTGNTGTYTFEFEFDEQWADLQIFVTFTGNSGTYVSKAENNRVTVPRELLINPGSCRFGVYGTNSSDDIKRMSSNLIELEVVQGAYSDGTAPAVPTPDLWEVLVTKTVPIIGENGNWWIWSIEEQGYIDSGVYASQKYDDTAVRQAIEDINSGKVDKIDGKALSANDFTDEDKAKLDSLENYDDTDILQSVGALEEGKADINDVYTKTETDEQIGNKADVATTLEGYGITDAYTKTEINSKENDLKLAYERLKYYGDKDIVPSDESYFTVNDTGETITGLTNTGKEQTELVIPYKINNVEITNIGEQAFFKNSNIASIIIPKSVITIGSSAFAVSEYLSYVAIPNSVTNIEINAFNQCTNLTNIILPNNITNISYGLFYGCKNLTNINIPNGVTTIESYAFYGCANLTNINIPNGVTVIGHDAFCRCSSLITVTIPDTITTIEMGTFGYCANLKRAIIPNSVETIGIYAFHMLNDDKYIPVPYLTIYCEQDSAADTYAKENNIPVVYTDIKATSVNPSVKTALDDITMVNTIYDLGVQTELTITLPSGQVGDFIQVDFISGETAASLTINSSSGLIGYDFSPETNMIYTLYFDWGVTGYDGSETSYGWRFNYSEYSVDIA